MIEDILAAGEEEALTLTRLLQESAEYSQGQQSLRDMLVNLSMRLPEPRSADLISQSLRTLMNHIEISYLKGKRQQIAREMSGKDLSAERMKELREIYQKYSNDLLEVQQRENAQLN